MTQVYVTISGNTKRMEKAKVALIQFCLSPPKTDMENQVVINDYSQMDRVLKEERAYTLNLVKAIKKSDSNYNFNLKMSNYKTKFIDLFIEGLKVYVFV